jgi:hypothetical protein
MTSGKRKDTGSWNGKYQMARFGELALEGTMDLTLDRLCDSDNELDTKAAKCRKPDSKQTPPFVQFGANNKYLIHFSPDSKCWATKQKINKTLLKYIRMSERTTMVYRTSNQKTEVNHRTVRAQRATETLNSIPVRQSKEKWTHMNIHEAVRKFFFNVRNTDRASA